MSELSRSKEYQKVKNRLFFFSLALDGVLLLIFFYSGLSVSLKDIILGFTDNKIIVNAIYVLAFCAGFYVIHFPLHIFSGFVWEHRFGLSNQKFFAWLQDELKGAGLNLFFAFVLIEVIYFFLGNFPRHWWVAAGMFWIFFSFILAKVTPEIIIPLFFKYQQIDNEKLRSRIFELFKKCQVSLTNVYAIDLSRKSNKANAFMCGLGNNRRVVLSDTLLKEFSDEEIEIVVAHELAHYKRKDIAKLLLSNSCVIFLGFFLIHLYFRYAVSAHQLSALDDISFLPIVLLCFSLFVFLTAPAINGYSRHIERLADKFAIQQTRNPAGFVSMIQKLGQMNLAEFEPNKFIEIFLYDHPPIAKRIAYAKQFRFH